MDYLTRRSIAHQYGVRGTFLAGSSQFPRIAALGVRISRDGTVLRKEFLQACADIGVSVELPQSDIVKGEAAENALRHCDPEQLKWRIDSFLAQLARAAHPHHKNRNS